MGLQHPTWTRLPVQDSPKHQGKRKFCNVPFQRPEFTPDQVQAWSALPIWHWKAPQKASSLSLPPSIKPEVR